MKKLIFLLFLFITQINFGQSNIVEINTTGSGETKEEAVQNALLSALKQSFGVFISSNTEIMNDVLTKDKISELSSGNILEYNIISETQNGNYYNTLVSSKISMNTLASYTKNKVDSNEISGDIFVSNFLIRELNKENELQSIKDLIEYSKKVLPTTLDFYINSGEPMDIDGLPDYGYLDYLKRNSYPKINDNYSFFMESTVGFKTNENYKIWSNHFNTTLEGILLQESDIVTYKKSKTKVYPIVLENKIYFVRSLDSYEQLYNYFKNTSRLTLNFKIELNGLNSSLEIQNSNLTNYSYIYEGTPIMKGRTCLCTIKNDGEIHIDKKPKTLPNFPLVHYTQIHPRAEHNDWDSFSKYSLGFKEEISFQYQDENYQLKTATKKISELISEQYDNLYKKYMDMWNKNNSPKSPKGVESITQERDDWIKQKVSKEFRVSYKYFRGLQIQNSFETSGCHLIITLFKFEDMKKFRGFQITNSN